MPLPMKLGIAGVAVALTLSVAASIYLPKLTNPEQNLARVAKRVAAGPSSPEDAKKIKNEFEKAVRTYLRDHGDQKTAELTAGLQKLLPSSAYEVHVAELPRGLRVVEIDTLLQANDFLVMKTQAGLKVFDLNGFEVFDDGRIVNDSAGPVLTLIGHSGGQPPHKPQVRTYALLPDYISDETEKLVPPLHGDGQAAFVSGTNDIYLELLPASGKHATSTETVYGTLRWKNARYTADFSAKSARIAHRHFSEPLTASAPAAVAPAPAVATASQTPSAPAIVPPSRHASDAVAATASALKTNSSIGNIVVAAAPGLAKAVSKANAAGGGAKIVVRGLTDHPLSNSGAALLAELPPAASANGAAAAAVPPVAAAAARPEPPLNGAPLPGNGTRSAVPATHEASKPSKHENHSHEHGTSAQANPGTTSNSYATVTCSGATVRSAPARGSSAIDGLSRGAQVEILSRQQDWYKVRYMGGREGFVYASLLSNATSGRSVASDTGAGATASHHRHRHRAGADGILVADAAQPGRSEHQKTLASATATERRGSAARSSGKHKRNRAAITTVVEAPNLVP
jgi:hypothetical protein